MTNRINEEALRKKLEDEILNTIRTFWDKSMEELSHKNVDTYDPIERLVEQYSTIMSNELSNNAILMLSMVEDSLITSKKGNS